MTMATESIVERIIEGLKELFPEAEQMAIDRETTLDEMPEWDSMTAVNLQTYLFQAFDIEVPLELLSDETSIFEIASFLKEPIGLTQ